MADDQALLKRLLGPKEMAPFLGVDPRTIRRWMNMDLLPYPDFECDTTKRWKPERIKAWYEGGGSKRRSRAKMKRKAKRKSKSKSGKTGAQGRDRGRLRTFDPQPVEPDRSQGIG